MEPKMYNISSIENSWAGLAQIFLIRNFHEKVFTKNNVEKVPLFNKS
jgi:hypothetical protein